MTEQHPITPPPELVEQLRNSPGTWLKKITNAYQAGADQELEACCEWLDKEIGAVDSCDLRADRRPKSPSLKEQALHELNDVYNKDKIDDCTYDTILAALESLDD
jgi:hypothetical protein